MDQGTGTLAITGFVRGGSLDVNKLVHLPYGGDFQLDRIESASDPYGYSKGRHKGQEEDMREAEGMVLATADPEKQQDLVAYVEPDMLDQEQTFPTEEELQQADEAFHAAQKKVCTLAIPALPPCTTRHPYGYPPGHADCACA
jgi:pre-rRNA-processing protein TSR1